MANYRIEVADIIAGLKQRLNEYEYRGGETILRELVQNADDADARQLSFLVVEQGLPDASCSLLHGPALIAVNDGRFLKTHRESLTRQSSSSKASDDNAVGRFGIGQKSVFHLCEAFCFLGSSEEDGRIGDTLDPWYDGSKDESGREIGDLDRPDWGALGAEDRDRIQSALGWILPEHPRWFVLWIPLRTKAHARRGELVIAANWAESLMAGLREAVLSEELSLLRPQLKSVRQIAGYLLPKPSASGAPQFTVDGPGDLRMTRGGPTGVPPVRAEVTAGNHRYEVFVREVVTEDARFDALKQSPEWPQHLERDEATLSNKTVPERAFPHGAVTIVRRRSADAGRVSLRWAVFLPLLEQPAVVDVKGPWSWWVTFHGYWFLDHGRRRVRGVSEQPSHESKLAESERIKLDWNRLVRDAVTLPAVLPALEEAVRDLPVHEATPLVEALAAFLANQPTHAWARARMFAVRATEERWAIIQDGDERRVLRVPRPPREVVGVNQVLRALMDQADRTVVCFDDRPLLRARGADAPAERDVAVALRAAVDTGLDVSLVDYLVQWLSSLPPEVRQRPLGRALWELAAATRIPGPASAAVDSWRTLVGLADPSRILFVEDLNLGDLAKVAKATPEAPALVLPAYLAPSRTSTPPLGDLAPIIRSLAALPEEKITRVLLRVISAYPLRAVLQHPALDQVRCLVLRRATVNDLERFTPGEIQALAAEGRVWLPLGVAVPLLQIPRIAGAILDPERHPYVVPLSEADSWGKVDGARGIQLTTVHALILGRAVLELTPDEARRADFLAAISTIPDFDRALETNRPDEPTKLLVRYVLHGDRQNARSTQKLWAFGSFHGTDTVRRLMKRAGAAWRYLSPRLTDALKPGLHAALGIAQMEADDIAEVLRSLPADDLRDELERASSADRWDFALQLRDMRDLGARLPIHRLSDGQLVSADAPRTYRRGTFPVPPAMERRVRLVQPETDPARARLQRDLVPEWTAGSLRDLATELIVDEGEDGLVDLLLEALAITEPSADTRSREWISIDGRKVAPASMMLEDHHPPEHARILETAGLVREQRLPPEVREHDGWKKHRAQLTPGRHDCWAKIASVLEAGHNSHEEYRLAPTPELVRGIFEVFSREPRAASRAFGSDVWGIATRCREMLGTEQAVRAFLHNVPRATWIDRFRSLGTDDHWAAFVSLARLIVDRTTLMPAILPCIEVRTADGKWRATKEVVRYGRDFAEEFRLDDDLSFLEAESDATSERATGQAQAVPQLEALADHPIIRDGEPHDVERFFNEWFERGANRSAGAVLLALLSCDGDIWDPLVNRWAPKGTSPEEIRAEVLGTTSMTQRGSRCDEERMQMFRTCRTSIEFIDEGKSLETESLAGTPMTARLSLHRRKKSLLVTQTLKIERGYRRIFLRRPPPTADADWFDSALYNGVCQVLEEDLQRYLQDTFHHLWRKLANDDGGSQLRAATALVGDSLPTTLRQLNASSIAPIGEALRELRELRYRIEKLRAEAGAGQTPAGVGDLEERLRVARQELVDLVRQHAPQVLERVRAKLHRYQYKPSQVAWELLQNADDAIVQLRGPAARGEGPDGRLVTIELLDAGTPTLVLRHRGRLINVPRPGAQNDAIDELDLVNMLVLNISDKEGQEHVTGKFGLGFKSVHLISAAPVVRSGPIRFTIAGGVLPIQLVQEPLEAQPSETVFGLPLDPALGLSLGDVVPDHLVHALPYLPLFATGLRKIELIKDERQNRTAYERRDFTTYGSVEIESAVIGWFDLPEQHVIVASRVSSSRRLAVVIGATADGEPRPLMPDATGELPPSVWVTVPVHTERWNLPYLVGAPFELDVGRTQVAIDHEANQQVARSLGEMMYALVMFYLERARSRAADGSSDAPTSLLTLWEIWMGRATLDMLRAEGGTRGALLAEMHRDGRGASAIAAHGLPTKLRTPWGPTTTAERVEHFVGADQRDAVLDLLDAFRRSHLRDALPSPGTIVLEETHQILKHLGLGRTRTVVTVRQLLGDASNALRDVGAPELPIVDAVRKLELKAADDAHHRADWLRGRRFQATDDSWHAADLLLIRVAPEAPPQGASKSDLEDEALRAVWAPPSAVLGSPYLGPEGSAVFLACRNKLRIASAEQLAEWARAIPKENRDVWHAVLRYLLSGALGPQVAQHLAAGRPAWLPERKDVGPRHPAFQGFEEEEQLKLVDMLYPRSSWDEWATQVPLPPPRPPVYPAEELPRVLAHWRRIAAGVWSRHDENVFGCQLLDLSFREPNREHWLALFTRASLYRVGRTHEGQHREFMRKCWERGWFQLFVDEPDTALSRIVRDYKSDAIRGVPYLHWIFVFAFTYWFADHLDDFLGHLENLDASSKSQVDIFTGVDARAAAGLAGGGYDLPPMTVLHFGTAFVLRELRRRKVLESHHWDPYCFPANRALRTAAEEVGLHVGATSGAEALGSSAGIYEQLAKVLGPDASFDLGFDLALLHYDKISARVREALQEGQDDDL